MDNSDNYGLIDSNDLLSSGELLPDGTRIFASHYTYTRLFWKLGFTTLGVVFLCFIGVVGCHVSTPAGSVFLCLFFVFTCTLGPSENPSVPSHKGVGMRMTNP